MKNLNKTEFIEYFNSLELKAKHDYVVYNEELKLLDIERKKEYKVFNYILSNEVGNVFIEVHIADKKPYYRHEGCGMYINAIAKENRGLTINID